MTKSREELAAIAQILKEAGWGVLPPDQYTGDMDESFLKLWDGVSPYTMISVERAWALARAIIYVCRSRIDGDIVECGVWKGGACLLASHLLHQEGEGTKTVWLYDTFSGMPKPGENDYIASTGQSLDERNPEGWWASGVGEVRQTLSLSPLKSNRFRLVEGRVEQTLVEQVPEKVAVLRLDTDWYESTMRELEVLYPRLESGGILLIDDYGHFTGAKKAVDEYFSRIGIYPLLHRSDYTGRVFVKP